MKKRIIIFLTLYILIKIFYQYKTIQSNVYYISLIFFKNIFPALFIFFVISSILINYDFIKIMNNSLGKIFSYLFNISNYATYIILMSMLSGLPSNAKYIEEMLESNLITNNEANKIVLFSHFANPLFILFIGLNKPYLIIFAHYIPNFIIGLFLRNYHKESSKIINITNKTKSFMEVLSNSIITSFNTLLSVLGLIIICYTLSNMTNITFLKLIIEMSSAITIIINYHISLKLKAMLIGGILSFGGLCVHMQVFTILKNKKIRYAPYLLARLIHFMLTTLIIYILY